MSINSALLSGVSGLLANSSALATISDNIANVNTVGYKRNLTDFQTLVTASGGGGRGGGYSAGGVLAQSRQRVSEEGQLLRSTSATDLGIQGAGFFVTTERPENLTDADARLFTRAGSFTLDKLGYLQNSAGLYLQGWPVDADGAIPFDPSDLGRLQSVNVAQVGGAVGETTRVGVTGNLNSDQPLSPEAATYDGASATASMAAYDPVLNQGVKPDFEFPIAIYDSKGGKRSVSVAFLRIPDPAATPPGSRPVPNRWAAEIYAVPSSDVESGSGVPGQIKRGIVAFTADGQLDRVTTTLFDDPAVAGNQYEPTLSFLSSGYDTIATPLTGSEVKWASTLGISGQAVQLNIADATGGLTQVADGRSYIRAITNDGVAVGSLTNIEIDKDGFVTALFDNGVSKRVAQVALATFPNTDGLRPLNGNAYLVSNESGTFNLKTPGTGGAGVIAPSTLEGSTVDLSSEFTGLITTQRAYSASSKIITTADEMLEELIRIKR